ncbi:MAG: hypothetical protein Q7R44_00050 [bacterium]|nr:hypothetical protein [bacterium]
MKLSKLIHFISVLVGFTGVILFVGTMLGGSDNNVFGITKLDALFCVAILILIAIWAQVAVIHHIIIEKKGEIL